MPITWQSVVASSQGAANSLFQSSVNTLNKGIAGIGTGLGAASDVFQADVDKSQLDASSILQATDAINTLPEGATRGLQAGLDSGLVGKPLTDAIANSASSADAASVLANRDIQAENNTKRVDISAGNTVFNQQDKNRKFKQQQGQDNFSNTLELELAKRQSEEFNLKLNADKSEATAKGAKAPTAVQAKLAAIHALDVSKQNPNFPIDGTPTQQRAYYQKNNSAAVSFLGKDDFNGYTGYVPPAKFNAEREKFNKPHPYQCSGNQDYRFAH